MFKQQIKMIMACSKSENKDHMCIGLNGEMPWGAKPFSKEDANHFKEYTKNHVVVMGSTTWKSLPFKLKDRVNIVLTRDSDPEHLTTFGKKSTIKTNTEMVYPDMFSHESLYDTVVTLKNLYPTKHIIIIGGANVYEQAIDELEIDELSISLSYQRYEYDTYLSFDKLNYLHKYDDIQRNIFEDGSGEVAIFSNTGILDKIFKSKFLNKILAKS